MSSISMVTPVFNGARTIGETIASVQSQTAHLREHIIVDALSKDDTLSVVRGLADAKTVVISEKDDGLYFGMNKGIQRAGGEIVGIINADDYLNPGALERVADAFSSGNVDYVYSDLTVIDASGNFVRVQPPNLAWMQGKTNLLGRDWRMVMAVAHPTLFVRKEVYDKFGLFDTSFRLSADHEFVARLIKNRLVGRYIADLPLASFRIGGESTRRMLECLREDERIARQYGVPSVFARLIRWRKSLWYFKNAERASSAPV